MAEVVLFHHVQGLTDGVRAFAEELRAGGHTVHTPDLFDGARLGDHRRRHRAHRRASGTTMLTERADRAVADLPDGLVYAGFSSACRPAQRLAQTRPGARGALLYESCIPITGEWAFGPWPDGVPVQIHGMDKDPFFALEGDIDAARELVETVGPSWPSCSSTRATGTCSPTARCRRTTPTQRRWWCSARGSSSTEWAEAEESDSAAVRLVAKPPKELFAKLSLCIYAGRMASLAEQTCRELATLRALTHPLRTRLLGALRVDGPATASELGRRFGESSGATSYHLRRLARLRLRRRGRRTTVAPREAMACRP